MAELTIRPEEIRAALDSFVKSYEPAQVVTEEVGRVSLAGDGIAQVEGLPGAMANELLQFEDGTLGLALSLDVREIGVVILGEFTGIEEGQEVRRTGEVLSVPVGDGYLGRVVDPLGTPIDGLGEVATVGRRALELQAPGVMQRKSVHEPLQTGLKAIDSMIPIGRGQRQLIIGDRQTGKTAIAVDTIINQKANWETGDPTKQVRCIYVAVGQRVPRSQQFEAHSKTPAHSNTPPSLQLQHLTLLGSNTWHPTPDLPLVSTGCMRVNTSSSCSMTCPSRRKPTVLCRYFFAAHQGVKRTPVTSFTCTLAFLSVVPSCQTSSVPGP